MKSVQNTSHQATGHSSIQSAAVPHDQSSAASASGETSSSNRLEGPQPPLFQQIAAAVRPADQTREERSLPQPGDLIVPTDGAFPALPAGLNARQRVLMARLEQALTIHRRILVKTEPKAGTLECALACLDRLLRYSSARRLLLLAGTASLKPQLRRAGQTWISLEDGRPLAECHRIQGQITMPLPSGTQACIATIREVQVHLPARQEDDGQASPSIGTALAQNAFDAIIVCGHFHPSPVWQRVLAYFDVPRIGFSRIVNDRLAALFDDHLISAS